MKKIESVTVCGTQFAIVEQTKQLAGGIIKKTFAVNIDGKDRTLGLEYTTDMVEALNRTHGLDAEDELYAIAEQEIRFELFALINDVKLTDVTSGKRVDLLKEFVSEFGVGYVDSEVQEKHIDIIAEALK